MHGNPLHRFAKRQRVLPTDATAGNARGATTTAAGARTTAAAAQATTASTRARAPAVETSTTARGRASLFSTFSRAGVTATEPQSTATTRAARTTANTVQAETTAATQRAVTSQATTNSAIVQSSSAPSLSSTQSSAAAKGTSVPDSSSSKSSSNGGTIAGVIIAIVVVVAAIVGFILWRKKRAARARGSGTALVGGGGNAGFKKHQDDDDEMFGNSSTGGSPFAGDEKYADHSPNGGGAGYRSMAAAGGAGAVGGWGAAQQYNSHQQQQQQPRQASPTWDSPVSYPTMSAAPASTANLLSNGQQPSHNEIESREMQQHLDNMRQQQQSTFNKPTGATASAPAPKGLGMMDAGLAGAAGIGAAKIANQQKEEAASSPFGDHPGQGTIHIVKRTFEPSLDDELVLFPGNRVQMLIKYDDGWALGINLDSPSNPPSKGVFPFDCLGEVLPSGASAPAPSAVAAQPQPQAQQPLHTIAEADSVPPSPTVAKSGAPPLAAAQQQEDDSLGYLAYDKDDEPAEQQTTSTSPHSSITSQLPPQLPNLRSDSPIDFSSPPASATTHANAPLSATTSEFTMPSIQISDPSGEDTTSSAATDYFGEQPQVPKSLQAGGGVEAVKNREGEKSKRTSSLIASRDADLFVALGEVLGRDDVKA